MDWKKEIERRHDVAVETGSPLETRSLESDSTTTRNSMTLPQLTIWKRATTLVSKSHQVELSLYDLSLGTLMEVVHLGRWLCIGETNQLDIVREAGDWSAYPLSRITGSELSYMASQGWGRDRSFTMFDLVSTLIYLLQGTPTTRICTVRWNL